jgi:hypothetical protein
MPDCLPANKPLKIVLILVLPKIEDENEDDGEDDSLFPETA